MDNSLDNNINPTNKIKLFYSSNKLKIIFIFISLFLLLISLIVFNVLKEKKNNSIAEKYVQAGLYLSSGEKNKAKNFYEEIINSKNKVYSILALNLIIEKNLVDEKKLILNYFQKLEKINYTKDKSDLIKLKKALYLIKTGEKNIGETILKNLVKEQSILGKISQQILE